MGTIEGILIAVYLQQFCKASTVNKVVFFAQDCLQTKKKHLKIIDIPFCQCQNVSVIIR